MSEHLLFILLKSLDIFNWHYWTKTPNNNLRNFCHLNKQQTLWQREKKNRGKLQTEQQQMDSSSSKMVKFGKIHCLTFHVLTFGRCSFPGNQFGTHRTWCYLFYVSACTQILMNSFLQHLLLRKSQHDSKCSVVQASSCVSLWISILPQKALLRSDYEKLKKKENVWLFFWGNSLYIVMFYSRFLLEKQSFLSMSYWKKTKQCVFIELKDYILRSVTEERRFVSVYWIQVLLSRTLQPRSE